jgi:hypothetical protein
VLALHDLIDSGIDEAAKEKKEEKKDRDDKLKVDTSRVHPKQKTSRKYKLDLGRPNTIQKP